MNLGEKYTHRITLRLTDDQFNFLQEISNMLDVSPSDYLRMSVNTGMITYRKQAKALTDFTVGKEEVGTHEDVKTNINNLV